MTDRELLELIANQVGNITNRVESLELIADQVSNITPMVESLELIANQVGNITNRVESLELIAKEIKSEVGSLKTVVVKIENEHGRKLGALFDGYTLNAEKLDRIEQEVSKHEEIILRRIR